MKRTKLLFSQPRRTPNKWVFLFTFLGTVLLLPPNLAAQGDPCTIFFESATTDLPGAPIRPFCSANGFTVFATIGHDDGCSTTGGDVYVIIEAQI